MINKPPNSVDASGHSLDSQPAELLVVRHLPVSAAALRLGGVLALVGLLVHLAQSRDVLLDCTRPLVIGLLRLLGVAVVNGADGMIIGHLHLPWTRDCAGLNMLLVLLAVVVWMHRAEPLSWRYVVRLALAVPAGLAANVARVLTLIAVRWVIFPSVESDQIHYLLGFVWLLPFLVFFLPKSQQSFTSLAVAALHTCIVLALLASLAGAPGGGWVTVGALACLAHCSLQPWTKQRLLLSVGWIAAAAFISMSRMESLWLPWLLVCPALVEVRLVRSADGLVLLLGTVPLFAMHPAGQCAMALALAWMAWRGSLTRQTMLDLRAAAATPTRHLAALPQWGFAAFFLLPFLAPWLLDGGHQPRLLAPSTMVVRHTANGGQELRLPGQPSRLGLVWYGPQGGGRHHTVAVCLKYRGVDFQPTTVSGVLTDGRCWMREFFIQEGALLPDYSDYLRHTFWPWSSPGIHVIAVIRCGDMDAAGFAAASEGLARQLPRAASLE